MIEINWKVSKVLAHANQFIVILNYWRELNSFLFKPGVVNTIYLIQT